MNLMPGVVKYKIDPLDWDVPIHVVRPIPKKGDPWGVLRPPSGNCVGRLDYKGRRGNLLPRYAWESAPFIEGLRASSGGEPSEGAPRPSMVSAAPRQDLPHGKEPMQTRKEDAGMLRSTPS